MDFPELSSPNELIETPPPVLYHYTSLAAFLEIIEHGKIWASHLRYLNDASEFTYGTEMFINRVRLLSDSVGDTLRATMVSSAEFIASTFHNKNAFVACFSEKRDDLSQWRAYCPPGQGICIGFKSSVCLEAIDPGNPPPSYYKWRPARSRLARVLYIDDKYSEVFDLAIKSTFGLSEAGPPKGDGSHNIHSLMDENSTLYKHPAFRDEAEWRIVLGANKMGPRDAKFRVGKSNLIPYLEIDLAKADSRFISELIIGPSPNMQLSVEAVQRLVQQKRHSLGRVQVESSAIPYRQW